MTRSEIFQSILNHFEVKRMVRETAYCVCPAHADKKPSLHISMGDKKIILDCKAGCDFKAILDAAKLKPHQLYYDFTENGRHNNKPRVSKKQWWLEKFATNRYDYQSIDTEKYTHTKFRTQNQDGSKGFSQGYYDEGLWVDNLNSIDTSFSIFCNGRIKELKNALANGNLVCYAEGEKDCVTLWKNGYIAFTCGPVKTFKQQLLRYLKNGRFIVFADNDHQGIEDARRISGLLNSVGKAKMIIPPDVPEKGDVTDYMSNHTSEDLRKLIGGVETKKTVTEKSISESLNIENILSLLDCKIAYDKDGKEKSRKILQTVRNFEIILENDRRFAGKIKFDEFSQQTYLIGDVPWKIENNHRAVWGSYDDSALFSILQSDYGMNNRNDFFDAIKNVSMRNKFHPVRETLDSLKWDGEEHILGLLPDYLGVEDTEYSYQVMRLWMLGAVARIFQPGIKFDYTMILQGKQGLGKSTFLQLLALNDTWFNDSLDSLDSDKAAAQSLMGSWIIELAELKSLARTAGGVDSVKRFLSARQDKFRIPYERRADIFLRQSVFAGTTNKSDFLQDETGNRRFLIIQTGVNEPRKSLFEPSAMDDIKAAWAQAVHIWKKEKPKLLLPDSCREKAEELQKESTSDDGKVGIIAEYLEDKKRTCAIEIWAEALHESGRPQKWQASEINNIVLGFPDWKRMSSPAKFGQYGSQRGFQKCSLQTQDKDVTKQECSSLKDDCSQEFIQISDFELSKLPFD